MTIPPEKAIELLREQIAIGEKMPFHNIYDDDEDYGQWRTTCEGILAKIDNSWARRFWNARYTTGGSRSQVAELRAFIRLLEVEIAHPTPLHVASPPVPTAITIQGDNARVNWNSSDQSTNTIVSAVDIWTELSTAIHKVPEPAREGLSSAAAAMKDSHGTPTFMQRYKEFMANAANHVAVLGPVVAKLASLF